MAKGISLQDLKVCDYVVGLTGTVWCADGPVDFLSNVMHTQGLILEAGEEDFFLLTDTGKIVKIYDYHGNPSRWSVVSSLAEVM